TVKCMLSRLLILQWNRGFDDADLTSQVFTKKNKTILTDSLLPAQPPFDPTMKMVNNLLLQRQKVAERADVNQSLIEVSVIQSSVSRQLLFEVTFAHLLLQRQKVAERADVNQSLIEVNVIQSSVSRQLTCRSHLCSSVIRKAKGD
ncbi:MAG: hypothetical protein M3R25_15325, partial [Bacteroidota bacterium]|nr:hypothetical protein [Bacteroidota bacterium]